LCLYWTTSIILQILKRQTNGPMGQTSEPTDQGAPFFYECYNLWKDFAEISIEHCDRESNQVAHELVQQAFMSKSFM
jgi:hypothetical protein